MSCKLSIIITTYNNRGLLRQLLKGLQAFPSVYEYEVIVVDNASKDATETMVIHEFPNAIFIKNKQNKGLAYGNNCGIKRAKGEYLLILNPDVAVFKNSCDKLIAFMDSHPSVGLVGPKLMNPDKSLQYSTYIFPKWYTPILRRTPFGSFPGAARYLRTYLMKEWNHNDSRAVPWVLGAAMCIRTAALKQVGMQDEKFFLYFEDVDWCRRFWNKGFQVWYAHDIPFIHYHRRESAEHPGWKGIINKITFIHIRSWVIYFKKYAGVPTPSI